MRWANKQHFFWDFDGVIKYSVDVKGRCFQTMFPGVSNGLGARIMRHHLDNPGLSREFKLPLYADWAREEGCQVSYDSLLETYSAMVVEAVVGSPWVPGVLSALKFFAVDSTNILVTAAPHEEIHVILRRLLIHDMFDACYGYPTSKVDGIMDYINSRGCSSDRCVFFGDSIGDARAALACNIDFVQVGSEAFDESIGCREKMSIIKDFTGLVEPC